MSVVSQAGAWVTGITDVSDWALMERPRVINDADRIKRGRVAWCEDRIAF